MKAPTHDTVYQGRVRLIQPAEGFRAGFDSLLLAAALPELAAGAALDLGCGAGGALLPAAWRLTGLTFTGVEADPAMAELARDGARANGFAARVNIETAEAGAWVRAHENRFDLVFANPPYFEPGRISGPSKDRHRAYLESLKLEDWIKAMLFAARPRAPVILVHRAADLARLLGPLDRQAGEITVLPVASKAGEPARRVLVRARKGLRRGALTLLPALVSHAADGTRTQAAQAMIEGRGLVW